MSLVDLVMPKMGESIMEATILKWCKQPGDSVKQDETVLEIATDKVDSEVPSIAEGTLEEVLFNVNDVVPIGSVIARIRTAVGETSAQNTTTPTPAQTAPAAPIHGSAAQQPAAQPVQTQSARPAAVNGHSSPQPISAGRFYSPLVLNIAASEGVPLAELETIPGSGNEGRVTKKDILQYVTDRKTGTQTTRVAPVYTTPVEQPQTQSTTQTNQPTAAPATTTTATAATTTAKATAATTPASFSVPGGNVEILEMDRMRRLIADHMVRSKHTSPHVTSFTEADVTNMVLWREKNKAAFEKREGTKITFTPIFIEAIVRCIRKYPLINSSLDGDKIIIKKDINIGMATALPSGNLIVPVIKSADQLNLIGLSHQVNTMADNARQGKLKPEDTQGGTFTMTNVGTFGSLMGTPIINQPQVAILAVGAIKKRPVVIETPEGDTIGIRHMMYLSLSYDHRIVDGSLGATFLTAVAKEFENFSFDREY
jgi:2-oxoglutarate dehydrogenase E2 component (dihydrolipoamide succinyltransferase)